MPSPDLKFSLDVTTATVTTAQNQAHLDYVGGHYGGLTIISGMAPNSALNYAGFNNDHFVNDAIKAAEGGLAPQTLSTAVYQNIHLVAGSSLTVNSTFRPGDTVHNDQSFLLLKNVATGEIAQQFIADVNSVNANGGAEDWKSGFRVGVTGDYNLLVGVADVGDKLRPSSLTVDSIVVTVPSGSYTIGASGVSLSDSSLLTSAGALQIGANVRPGLLSESGASAVFALQSALAAKLITQDGGGLISQDGGGIALANGLPLITQDGGGLLSQDGGGLLAASVGASSLPQITAGLVQGNELDGSFFNAGLLTGLTGGNNYGILSFEGTTTPVPDPAASPSSGPPVPGLEVNASGGAVAGRFGDSSAVADLGGGKYVVVFNEYTRDASGTRTYAIRAQVFNADGTPSGSEITVSPPLPGTTSFGTPANQLSDPSVASLGGGSFVVSWQNGNNVRPGATGGFSTGSDLFAQAINADGSKAGNLVSLDAGVTNSQYSDVKIAALSGGGYVAVWGQRSGTGSTSLSSIHGKLLNTDGSQRGAEFTLSGNVVLADLTHPAVAATADGGFAVSFQGRATNPADGTTITGIGAQLYDANGGAKMRNPTVVAISPTDTIEGSSVATLPNGNLAVVWLDSTTFSHSVYSLLLSPTGTPLESAPSLVTGVAANPFYGTPVVTALADGRFAVGFTAVSGSSYVATGQIMAADNTLSGASFPLYAPGGGDSEVSPALVQLSTGTLVASSTHRFDVLGASDVRALPITGLGSSSAGSSGPNASGAALSAGSAVHGYVSGGTVFADANGNGVQDAGEISAQTTSDGAFVLATGATGPLILTGGTDIATGKAFTGRYTAPAGSTVVDALTTLVQGVVASGADIGTAGMKVATALGLSADAKLTQSDPMATTTIARAGGSALLLANAVVAEANDLATGAGASDALGAFAASIAGNDGFTAFDPTSSAAMSAAGLKGQVLTDTSSIATAVKALLAARVAADASDPANLVNDTNRVEVVVQNAAAALHDAMANGTSTIPVAADYSGASLQAKFDAATTVIAPSTIGVYRFFDSKFGTHFFTASTGERDDIVAHRPDLISEGVGLHAIDPASHDPNASAVYRFFDTKFGTHFFTASASERDQVIASRPDLTFEGTGFYEHTTQQAGDVAVYRFFDKSYGTHFYTADAGERAGIIATRPDLVDEGIGFYAPKG